MKCEWPAAEAELWMSLDERKAGARARNSLGRRTRVHRQRQIARLAPRLQGFQIMPVLSYASPKFVRKRQAPRRIGLVFQKTDETGEVIRVVIFSVGQ
jgi:hypothetical protein